jgi:multisubunit Na+/H+ antiporter MnhF subunit
MNAFVLAAAAMLLGIFPCIFVMVREELMAAVVAYELTSSILVLVLICLAEGFGRSGEFELAVLLAVLMYGSGLVFVRSMERWL